MGTRTLWLILAAPAVALTGCMAVTPASREAATPAGPLVLAVEETTALGDATPRFVGVSEDSRCPSQVTWPGRITGRRLPSRPWPRPIARCAKTIPMAI